MIHLRWTSLLTGWLVLPAILEGQAAPSTPSVATASTADVEMGGRIFMSQCARCHGVTGTGGQGPSFTHPDLVHAPDDEALVNVIKNGIPGTSMAGNWALADREAVQVAAYVRSLGKVPPEPVTGDSVRGGAIYDGAGSCGTCHALKGIGAGWAPDLTGIGNRRGVSYLRQSLVDPGAAQPDSPLPTVDGGYPGYLWVRATSKSGARIEGTRINEDNFTIQLRDTMGRLHSLRKSQLSRLEKFGGQSPMPSYRDRLSGPEIEDLVAYLASQRGAP
jgi:putative heme-binding domain-containing protein